MMDMQAIFAVIIAVLTYAAILSGKVHKTVAALLGGCAMVLLRVVGEEEAFQAIDLGVIFLLTGMMVISHFLAKSGFFGYVAIRIAQLAKGRPLPLLVLLCTVTGLLSALVDNVTTIVLIAPVTFLVAEQLEVNPVPYLLFEVMAANVGGTATLIGDPPNILIGSKAGLTFNQFLINLGPIVLVCLALLVGAAAFAVRKSAHVSSDIRARIMEMNPAGAISDRRLMLKSLFGLSLVLTSFLLHGLLHIGPAPAALAGAALLLLFTHAEPSEAFGAVEWPTLFFFVGLFLTVAGLAATGVLDQIARFAVSLTGSDLFLTAMVVLWFAAITSAFIGAIPIVTALIPVVQNIIPGITAQGTLPEPVVAQALWWSLALGACLGGNGTVFGTAANVVVVEIARNNRREISFAQFLRYGLPVTFVTLVLSSIYVLIRYVP
ncbi:MAG: ArsB/NhaD family transporter [Candidatus Hydrogenedentes bacterium]|nr:ArsB/NhaD family transporter [Candidatus Hydrogenedentota bacterium]